ncbi:ABC transporter ATP-binding protein [Rhizobium leguminosarum]|uniref:ABC transporter ATP-binding protein n=1 Tax=Rhizobium leguminosarum TaxID=384 RepID=UPI001609B823|nr:ABC transporter ATP-binding protein [Rhizobium leguminosarum]MBB4342992.1 ATP-binding cassette subfamily B protein [Rhizobium leguminosarum]MBB6296070.1 ATP-binding cassette subfamily B protein [Rhizobium leguminosarum]
MNVTLRGCSRIARICWRQDRRRIVSAVTLVLLGAAASPLLALCLRWLTHEALTGKTATAALAGCFAAVLLIASLTFGHFAHILYFELAELSVLDLDAETIAIVNGGPGLGHFERPDDVDRMTVLRQEMPRFNSALKALLNLAGLALSGTLTLILLSTVNPLLLFLPLLALPPVLAGRWAEEISDRSRIKTAEQSRLALNIFKLTTNPEAAKELRAARLGALMIRRHADHWNAVSKELWKAHLKDTWIRAAGQLMFAVGYAGALLLVVYTAIAGHATVGDVVLSIMLAVQMNAQVSTAVILSQDLQRMANAFRRLDELALSIGAKSVVSEQPSAAMRIERGIDLIDVGFSYPTDGGGEQPRRAALHGINLHLPAGATVAVVGENGAGKSTLVKLLSGLYEPTEGEILVDGVPIEKLPRSKWQSSISATFQDFVRFELPVRYAVGIGDLETKFSDEAITKSLESAGAARMVAALDRGIETELGKQPGGGAVLSGGQWQTIALARGFMRPAPSLLILDEPTASLDPLAERSLFERYVQKANKVAQHSGGITLFITHRFSTVRVADLIVVVSGGTIAEVGTHESLIDAGGVYARLNEIQAAGYR